MTTYSTPPKIIIHPANESGAAMVRCVAPAAALRMNGLATTIGRMNFLTADELKVAAANSIVLQGQYHDPQLAAIKTYRKTLPSAHLVYELDDAVWEVLPSNPASREIPKDVKRRVKTAISLCDTVTVTTEHLAKVVRATFKPKNITVIPNRLTSRFINEAEAGRRSAPARTKPRIGWAGSISHADDIAFLKDVIAHFGNRIQWVFQGLLPAWIDATHPDVEFHEFTSLADYPRSLGKLNLDLALAPLQSNSFNDCKSNLKLLEYGAAGFAVLADKTIPYNGFPHIWHAAEHTPQAWIQAIEALLLSMTGLEAIGERLSEYVKANYRLEDHLVEWQAAWLPKGATPFSPSASRNDNRLILRDGTTAPHNLQERLEKHLGQNASVSCLHNGGVYPVAGSYVDVPSELAVQLDEAADFAGCDPVAAPYPTGPAILLSGTALDRLGEPDVARYGTMDAALLEWGARAMEAGYGHAVATDTYAASPAPVAYDQEASKTLINHLAFWTPFFPEAVQGYGKVDPLEAARRNVELSFIRREYSAPDAEVSSRILLINASEDDVKAAVTDSLVFCAQLEGHFLHFTYPRMPNVAPIDTREPIDAFIEVLGRLALPHIGFKGIGDGTIGAVGFMADVAEAGWRVDAEMPEELDTKHHVSKEHWQATWTRLISNAASVHESV